MIGDLDVFENGAPTWSGFMGSRGLVITGKKSDKVYRHHGFTINPHPQLRQFSKLEKILGSHVSENDRGHSISLLIPGNTDIETLTTLKEDIRKEVPLYLIPEEITFIEEFPLSGDGQINSSHPYYHTPARSQREEDLPSTYGERQLADIWKSLLGVKQIYRFDNFFALGGYSLLPLVMINEIEKRTGVRLEIGVFLTQNLGSIATQCGFREPSLNGPGDQT